LQNSSEKSPTAIEDIEARKVELLGEIVPQVLEIQTTYERLRRDENKPPVVSKQLNSNL
jgi:hypothetical protein